jgi:hypothetical protein
VSAQDSKGEVFDVFLCHNSEDKPAVREIAKRLVEEGINLWLDEEQMRPGSTWQTAIGQQIATIKSAAVFVGQSGFGPWQNEEVQAFLNEFIERKCPVIPAILSSAKTTPDLPWTLKNRHRVDFRLVDPDPIRQLIWGITGEKPTARESLIPEKNELSESRTRYSASRLYPPLAEQLNQQDRTQLEILRRRVMEYWVDGVLKHSLYKEVLISLGKRQVDEFVDAPWKYKAEFSDKVSPRLLPNRNVPGIYDSAGLLLILGEPGSGKTTALLELARTLLHRTGQDIRERVAVVLNLSSWKKKQPLAEWISAELSEKYRVPRKIGKFWLQNNYLLPLLDGLDEVQTSIQPDCVAAINAFIEESNPSGLVVCCRLNEYRWLPERLKLNGAIRIEPLSEGEVDEYLTRGGAELVTLREAVETDPVLQELAQTPLMLSTMSLAFQGVSGDELIRQIGDSPKERRKQMFGLYVDQMFQRKGTGALPFPKDKTIGWLSWLARKMKEHSQSVFLVEALQPNWLDARANRLAYGTIVALSVGLIFGVIAGLIYGLGGGLSYGLTGGLSCGSIVFMGVGLGCWSDFPLVNGIISGSIVGLSTGLDRLRRGFPFEELGQMLPTLVFFGMIGGAISGLGVRSLNHITLVETLSWNWSQFWKRAIPGSIVGLTGALAVALSYGLSQGLRRGLHEGLSAALTLVLFGGLITGLIGGLTATVKADKASPNQGIKLSRKNSLAVFLAIWLSVGLSFGLIFGLIGRLVSGADLGVDLALGLIFGLIGGLNRGASTVIKHYSLRLILWLTRCTPFKFIKFLDYCAKLILLKKVGGGYIFIHRMLLEYFAELNPRSKNS